MAPKMSIFARKLYALLGGKFSCSELQCLTSDEHETALAWWTENQGVLEAIASSSDHINFEVPPPSANTCTVSHPISGQKQSSIPWSESCPEIPEPFLTQLQGQSDPSKVFWWLWRFLPEQQARTDPKALLTPQHHLLPDCPQHSYRATVSALAGAMTADLKNPYLLIFTFSPVQEFIKASRKFFDFWAGSYLLHYLSAKLCWFTAQRYGPDAVITPSLWGQEIIDALIVKDLDDDHSSLFADSFRHYCQKTPVERFANDPSLSTAGLPNTITALIPEDEVESFAQELLNQLKQEWAEIAGKVRQNIRSQTLKFLVEPQNQQDIENLIQQLAQAEGKPDHHNPNHHDLKKLRQENCWSWGKLWEAQINHTWDAYWAGIPLGHPEQNFSIHSEINQHFDSDWKQAQESISPSRHDQQTPTEAEDLAYTTLNVGTWWANSQNRLGQAIQAVKNTRNWRMPAAPGERSTLSGQFTALHPFYLYREPFQEGAGLRSGSLQLFWKLMALVYPGLFNGSEKLNALEVTKRMAWVYGGVAESLGLTVAQQPQGSIDYESFIRFPNLSSIAAARFAQQCPKKVKRYWETLNDLIHHNFTGKERELFRSKTRRPFQVPQTDQLFENLQNPNNSYRYYNGVAFSAKWLADDMGLNETSQPETEKVANLRSLVHQAHQDCGFGESSPADWWVIIAADGDSMGQYVSGRKLDTYEKYVQKELIENQPDNFQDFLDTHKRMGPATHVGLNRALLDFSNRLVPYLTEQRFCGRVVYSGGDDVLAVLPLTDLPDYLLSLRAAWSGDDDPKNEFRAEGGYWYPPAQNDHSLPQRPLFTMGKGATTSAGIIIAHKTVPLPTVLESLWEAEAERAKKLWGVNKGENVIPAKDGCCFRVIYGGGNTLEALLKGHLLSGWRQWLKMGCSESVAFAPVLYRLAEELPRHAVITENYKMVSEATRVILTSRDTPLSEQTRQYIYQWLDEWELWAWGIQKNWNPQQNRFEDKSETPLGIGIEDLAKVLRFSAFWVDKMAQYQRWTKEG